MRPLKRPHWSVALVATALAASALPGGVASAAPGTTSNGNLGSGKDASRIEAVTLITGDRVIVAGEHVTVRMAPGRERVGYVLTREKGRVRVVPGDALAEVRAERLDPRLFDVTTLIESGYTDDRRADVPLLVPAGAGLRASGGYTSQKVLKKDAAGFWAGRSKARLAAPQKLWLDGMRKPLLDRSVAQVGAPQAWAAGHDGTGVTVAVLDTGVDAGHPDLAGRLAAVQNFSPDPDADDTIGHGTHVASTIAGAGAKYKGVAPGAKLAIGKVCFRFGCPESAILAGMRWAAVEQRAKVVNISLGLMDSPGVDPVEEAVNTLSAETGALFVVASGNSGPDSVSSPATADAALAVGAVDSADKVAPFSSGGPRSDDGAIKPEISAPGVGIVAARAARAELGPPIDERYTKMSGTSMATPHVAGAAAILAAQHPQWTGQQIKNVLIGTAKPLDQPVHGVGAGRLDVARAHSQTVLATAGALSFGVQEFPHADDELLKRTASYRNDGTAPVTLTVRTEGTGPDGKPAPAGMFTVDKAQVVVPAGGTAEVTVTADTRAEGPDGWYAGRVVATAGDLVLTNPLTVHRERRMVLVTVRTIVPEGWDVRFASPWLTPYDETARFTYTVLPDGALEFRVPPGRYDLWSTIIGNDGRYGFLSQPVFDVTGSTTIEMQGGQAKRLQPSVPDSGAKLFGVTLQYAIFGGSYGPSTLTIGGTTDLYSLHIGPPPPPGRIKSLVSTAFVQGGVEPADSPYFYRLAWAADQLPTGLSTAVQRADLATVRVTTPGFDPGYPVIEYEAFPNVPGLPKPFFIGESGFLAPARPRTTRTEYYLGQGMTWSQSVLRFGERSGEVHFNTDTALTYLPGRRYQYRVPVEPVFGPGVVRSTMWRQGDAFVAYNNLYSAGDGWVARRIGADVTAKNTLYRNGVKLVEDTNPNGIGLYLPEETSSGYRLVMEFADPTAPVSDRITSEWTFRSGTTQTVAPVRAIAVEASPRLDEEGYAPAGKMLRLPVRTVTADGSVAGKPVVEVSFDGGTTWQAPRMICDASGWHAQIQHPATAGDVALRLSAQGTDGSSVKSTIHKAYRTR
ncbi:S8 family serine peptidase [Longispora albida]|uniref:S8 family serine peptidase n=1 Tax=Longispora albida TaxID=203523 RepID=UPI0003AB39D1|nr:S8 family serine peptidase [Longispora albida]